MLKGDQLKSFGIALDKAQSSIISLNIGGQIFSTTIYTLIKYDSLFKEICNGTISIPQKNNNLFFDRDPTHFQLILNYFRTGYMQYPANPSVLQALKAEIK